MPLPQVEADSKNYLMISHCFKDIFSVCSSAKKLYLNSCEALKARTADDIFE